MSKPVKGTKRVCQSCGARFYDLNRTPIVCPVCQTVYQIAAPTSRRGERAAAETRPPVVAERKESPVKPVEVISLAEAEETGDDIAIEEEEDIDLGDDEADIPAAGEEDTFLEETEGDEGADVTGIVGDAEKGEES